jgi:hypothetical protein
MLYYTTLGGSYKMLVERVVGSRRHIAIFVPNAKMGSSSSNNSSHI